MIAASCHRLITGPLVMQRPPRWTLCHRRRDDCGGCREEERGGDERDESGDDDDEEEEDNDSMAAHLWSPAMELAAAMAMAAIVFD